MFPFWGLKSKSAKALSWLPKRLGKVIELPFEVLKKLYNQYVVFH